MFISKINGDRLGAPESVSLLKPVPIGEEVDVSVDMFSPSRPGRYVGFWRLCAPDGRKFGQRVWVKIDVLSLTSDEESNDMNIALDSSFRVLEHEVEKLLEDDDDHCLQSNFPCRNKDEGGKGLQDEVTTAPIKNPKDEKERRSALPYPFSTKPSSKILSPPKPNAASLRQDPTCALSTQSEKRQ